MSADSTAREIAERLFNEIGDRCYAQPYPADINSVVGQRIFVEVVAAALADAEARVRNEGWQQGYSASEETYTMLRIHARAAEAEIERLSARLAAVEQALRDQREKLLALAHEWDGRAFYANANSNYGIELRAALGDPQ